MPPVIVFDLDETVIDSRHRTPRNPDGTVDLGYYMTNHTPENVFRDTLRPLAKIAQAMFGRHYVIFCTARDMKTCDYEFLQAHNLRANLILSRDRAKPSHYKMRDADYKARWLTPLRNLPFFRGRPFVMFDDEPKVISRMRQIGISCYNAHSINRMLTEKAFQNG